MRLLLLLAVLLIPAVAVAQAAPPASAAARPDIQFSATVRMDAIEFGSDPEADVRFTGGPRLDTRHDVERDGLPKPVAAGRTYRDVTVRTTISATLLDPAAEAGAQALASPSPSFPPTEDAP